MSKLTFSVAGTGCIIGETVISCVAESNLNDIKFEKLNQSNTIEDIFIKMISFFGKPHEIELPRDAVFKPIMKKYKNEYKIIYTNILEDIKEKTETFFMEQLYQLGVNQNIKLNKINGKNDYHQLHIDLINELYLKPELLKFTKNDYSICIKIEKLVNDYPNLYKKLLV